MITAPSRRSVRLATWAVVPIALIVSGLAMSNASYAAFSAVTTSPNDTWSSGTVTLSDDDAGASMFTVTGMKPGATGTKCIKVSTGSGTLASAIKLYGTSSTTTLGLNSAIDMTIEQGAASGSGSFASCSGFTGSTIYSGTLANFGSTYTSYGTGVTGWTTTGGADYRVYRITYTLNTGAANSTQGGTAGISFTWEAQNT